MVAEADGGGGGGYDLPMDQYYTISAPPRGSGGFDDTFHWTSHSFAGYTYNNGKDDAFNKVKSGLDEGAVQNMADAWKSVNSQTSGLYSQLSQLQSDTFSAWSGDDADQAKTIFQGTTNSSGALQNYSSQLQSGTQGLADAIKQAKGAGGSESGLDKVGNWMVGSDGGGGDAEQAYFNLVANIQGSRDQMPYQIEHDVKTSDTSAIGGYTPSAGGGAAGGAGGANAGGGAAHTSVGDGTQIGDPGKYATVSNTGDGTDKYKVKSPVITDPPPRTITDPKSPPISDPVFPPISSPPYHPITGPGGGTGGGQVGVNPPGGGIGTTLSGYHPSGSAGGGSGGAGAVGGGLAGGGVGGGLASSGSGAGVGGVGLSGGLAGAGGGAAGDDERIAGAGVGSGAAGGRGAMMAPMRGGGSGDDDERERNTWLTEDDDVWGESDAPPGVIS